VTMRRQASAVGLVSMLALLGLVATACTKPARDSRTAIDLLNDAVAKAAGQSFTYTLTYGSRFTGEGAQDTGAGRARLTMTVSDPSLGASVKVGSVIVGSDVYIKLDLGGLGALIPGLGDIANKWLHMDSARAPKLSDLGIKPGADIAGPDNFIKGVVSAEKASDTRISGKLDLSRASVPAASQDETGQLSAAEKMVPFTATLDTSGRIATITVSMPKLGDFPASDLTMSYSGYGSAIVADKPDPAVVTEAPDAVYAFLA
jgi:hypothetical protein